MRSDWTPIKGIDRDRLLTRFEPGASFDHVNIVDFKEGNISGLTNESGTDLSTSLLTSGKVIGHVFVSEKEAILFLSDNQIILWDFVLDTQELILESDLLEFNDTYPIHGVSKVINGCERVVYFTDNLNPVRALNIDRLDQYYEDSVLIVDRLKLNRPLSSTDITNINVLDSGGSLKIGSYRFAYRFIDVDGNVTNWSSFTQRVNVYDDPNNGNWTDIDGAQNIEEYTEEEGGLPRTNKKIQLNFANLDASFKSIQVAVVPYTQGIGFPEIPYTLNPVNITSDTALIFVTGNDSEIEEEITFEELTIPKVVIETAKTLEQHDKSLWIGNVQEKTYDWSAFQAAASKIRVRVEKEAVPALEIVEGNSKHPINGSLIPGEVYALGIRFHMSDGSKSPTFHIPGRAATGVERNVISIWSENVEPFTSLQEFVDDYGKSEAESTTKPVVRNFQIRDYIQLSNGYYNTAYYEGINTYPEVKACDGSSIWGQDYDGNNLEGLPIRHHKVPSRGDIELAEVVDDVLYINNLNFVFDNIEFPSNDVVGYSVMQAVRAESDRTIVDAGYFLPTKERTSAGIKWWKQTARGGDLNKHVFEFVGPEGKVNGIRNADYAKVEYEVAVTDYAYSLTDWNTLRAGLLDFSPDIDIINLVATYIDHSLGTKSTQGNYIIDKISEVSAETTSLTGLSKQFRNSNKVDKALIYELGREYGELDVINKVIYVTLRNVSNPFEDLDALTYVAVQTQISTLEIDYPRYWDGVSSMFSAFSLEDPQTYLDTTRNVGTLDYVDIYLSGLWVDGYINTGLLHSGSTICNQRYKEISSKIASDYVDANEIPLYAIYRIADLSDDGKDFIIKQPGSFCTEYYQYNQDFSTFSNRDLDFPILSSYNYCDDCRGKFPDRLYYSQRDDQEDSQDNYRVFLPNNYSKIDELGSDINKILANNDKLYVWTDRHLYFVPTRPQEIQSNESTIFLGTGARLSIPPVKLLDLLPTYGGTNQIQSVIRTPAGIAFTDISRRAVYLLRESSLPLYRRREGNNDISKINMASWFRDYLPFELEKYAPVNIEHISGRWTVGTKIVFDSFHNRLLLYKKDYKPKVDVYLSEVDKVDGGLYYRSNGFYRYKARTIEGNSPWIPVDFTNEDYFENKSFMISYSFVRNGWLSFHEWEPEYMLDLGPYMGSSKDAGLYKHTNKDSTIVYEDPQESQFSVVIADQPLIEKHISNITFRSQGIPDSYWIYNDRYTTGRQSLSQDVAYSATQTPYYIVKDGKQFNKILNYFDYTGSTSDEEFTWESPTNIDFTKSQLLLQGLQGRYFKLKFYSSSPIILEDVTVMWRKAQR